MTKDFSWLINQVIIGGVLEPVKYLLLAWAVIMFLWGVLDFFSEKNRDNAKKHVLYGVIGLFVMGAYLGLVWVVERTLKLDNRPINESGTGGGGGQVTPPPGGEYDFGDNIDDTLN